VPLRILERGRSPLLREGFRKGNRRCPFLERFIKGIPMGTQVAMSEESDMAKEKTNPELVLLIKDLKIHAKRHNTPIWRDIAERLERPLRVWPEVNVSRIERYAKEGEVIIVPGKVLGSGILTKKVNVAAWKFSKSAKEKIEKAGGRVMTIRELMMENPKGSNVRLMG